ncbi:rCG55823, partial [Rattus norvegicus]
MDAKQTPYHRVNFLPHPMILPFKRKSYQMDKYMIKVLSS